MERPCTQEAEIWYFSVKTWWAYFFIILDLPSLTLTATDYKSMSAFSALIDSTTFHLSSKIKVKATIVDTIAVKRSSSCVW